MSVRVAVNHYAIYVTRNGRRLSRGLHPADVVLFPQ